MKKKFSSAEQVETFLTRKGIQFHRGTFEKPAGGGPVSFWQVKVGKNFCEVYDIVSWANIVHSSKI